MKHLYLMPTGGLCNRMRAIAAARRLVSLCNIQLSVVWDWGAWNALFSSIPGIDILSNMKAIPAGLPIHNTRLFKDGGNIFNQKLVLSGDIIALKTGHIFSLEGLPEVAIDELIGWLPKPCEVIEKRVLLEREMIQTGTVGVHIRRTDNFTSIRASPDRLFHQEISQIVTKCLRVYLATDNEKTRAKFTSSFPGMVRTLQFRRESVRRWPVKHRFVEDAQDDFVDLLVLSRCDWVLGSLGSSFSETAITLNKNPKSRFVTD